MKFRTVIDRGPRHNAVALARLGFATLLALAPLASCSGAQQPNGHGCNYGAWQGKCRLALLRTARTVERFPTSFVVLEATYEPQMTEGALSPPGFTREFTTPANNQAELENHLKANELVECQIQPPATDSCSPPMVANVPTFLPKSTATGPTGPAGCAKIERSGNAPIPATAVLPGPFQFQDQASTSNPDVEKVADEAARKILADPKIECVAVKGKNAPGEDFMLANERAQLVKRLLEQRGIDKSRVTVFEATAPAYTANPNEDQPAAVEQRRVYLSVVVYGQ